MKKAVIFDMDGVLVDNSEIHIDAFEVFCKRHNCSFERQELYPLFGKGNRDIFPVVLKRPVSAEEIERFSQEKEAIYRELIEKTIRPLPGLIDFLTFLKAKGVKTAVGSSGIRKNVDFVLKKCGIAAYFDVVVNGNDVKNAKPDPEIFLLVAERLGIAPEECVVFEDAYAGIEAARTARMAVVAVATTFPKEQHCDYDMIISDFRELDRSAFEKL